MYDHPRLGIKSIGVGLPEEVRTNEWWSKEIVESWNKKHVWDFQREQETHDKLPFEGIQIVLKCMAEYSSDPFHGAIERRTLKPEEDILELEISAAQQAIEKAQIDAGQIGFVLSSPVFPNSIGTNNACPIHHKLRLRDNCLALEVNAACNSFQTQLKIAELMIKDRPADFGLLVQSSNVARMVKPLDPFSIHFGDGATAVIVGATDSSRGILAQMHKTEGSNHKALICRPDDGNWWDNAPSILKAPSRKAAKEMLFQIADLGKDLIGKALRAANIAPDEVDFFACHQATAWLRRAVQETSSLGNAKYVDTYPTHGSISAGNLPLVLHQGLEKDLLKEGDIVVLFQGGNGQTLSATVLKWGI